MGYRPSLRRVVVEPRDLSPIYTVTRKLLPLFIIDIIRVVFDLQEGNGRRAVVEIRSIKIRVKPHVETVPVLHRAGV